MASPDLHGLPRCPFNTPTIRDRTDTSQHPVDMTVGSLVSCTHCIRSLEPAVKSCVTCDASMCQKHVEVHDRFCKHDLCEPTDALHNRRCPIHREPLTHYCSEDASLLCNDCSVLGEHKGHSVDTLRDASEKKKEKLGNALKKRRLREERAQKRIERLQVQIVDITRKGNVLTDNISSFHADLRRQLQAMENKMVQEVSDRQQKVIDAIREQIQEQEIKMRNLSEQISYTEELCNMTDPLAVMRGQMFGNSNTSLAKESVRRMSDDPEMHELEDAFISMTLHQNLLKLVNNVRQRKEFHVPEVTDMVLNAHTAGDLVFILGDGKTACESKLNLGRPETPGKFYCPQALSSKSFSSGQHAWGVEAGGVGDWMIGVAYPSIERTGYHSYLGTTDKSWCLKKSNEEYSVNHNGVKSLVDAEETCQRFFIYLDYDVGRLSFYQLSNPINHLHTFKADFTEPLHAAFTIRDDAWLRICS